MKKLATRISFCLFEYYLGLTNNLSKCQIENDLKFPYILGKFCQSFAAELSFFLYCKIVLIHTHFTIFLTTLGVDYP